MATVSFPFTVLSVSEEPGTVSAVPYQYGVLWPQSHSHSALSISEEPGTVSAVPYQYGVLWPQSHSHSVLSTSLPDAIIKHGLNLKFFPSNSDTATSPLEQTLSVYRRMSSV